MNTQVYKIVKSEYEKHYEILLEVNGAIFNSQSVFTKEQIISKFNVSHKEFEQLLK